MTVATTALDDEAVQAIFDYQAQWFDVKAQHDLRVDVDPPSAQLDYHVTYVSTGQILVIDASDAVANQVASGIAQVFYDIVGDANGWIEVDQNPDGCWCFAFNPTVDKPQYDIALRAIDRVGHTAPTIVRTLTKDDTPPGISLLENRVYQATTSLTVSGLVGDDESGVNPGVTSVQVTDRHGETVGNQFALRFTGSNWWATQAIETPLYGAYSAHVAVENRAGKAAIITERDVVLRDGIAPYADVVTASRLITTSGTVISGIANDSRYAQSGRSVHFHFEEAAGATTFGDARVNRFVATCDAVANQCLTAGTSGQEGSALTFDGQDDYLTVPHVLDPSQTSFTAAAWFKVNDLAKSQLILQQQDDSTGGIGRTWLMAYKSGIVRTNIGNASISSSSTIVPGQWHHIAVTYDANSQTAELYLDGQLANRGTAIAEASTGAMLIGINKPLSNAFDGALDEVVIYARTLSADEIYDIANPLDVGIAQTQIHFRYASGAVWPDVDPDNLALYLPLDENVGSTNFDDLAMSNHHVSCVDGTTCPVAGADGQHAKALSFDGVDDYLTVPHVLDPSQTSFTAAAWFQVTDLAKTQFILQQQDDGTGGTGRTWLLAHNSGVVCTNIGSNLLSSSSTTVPGQWHHVAVTYDVASKAVELYLDGQLTNSGTATAEATMGAMLIGASKTLANTFELYFLVKEKR